MVGEGSIHAFCSRREHRRVGANEPRGDDETHCKKWHEQSASRDDQRVEDHCFGDTDASNKLTQKGAAHVSALQSGHGSADIQALSMRTEAHFRHAERIAFGIQNLRALL